MSGLHGFVSSDIPPAGTGAPFKIKTTYTGINENINSSNLQTSAMVDLSDWKPGAVRYIRQEGQGPDFANATGLDRHYPVPRTIDLCNAGVFCIPCISTTFSSTANFKGFLGNWIDRVDAAVDNPPLWWEIGNEPGGGQQKPANLTTPEWQAQIRATYLTKMVAASEVLEARKKKLIMTAWIGVSGGTSPALQDIVDGVSNSDPDMVHAMAVHAYAQQGQDNPNSAYNLSNVRNAVFGARNVFDNFGSGTPGPFEDKPIFVTETGQGCTFRANGTNPNGTGAQNQIGGDWSPGQSNFTDGKVGPANRVIGLQEQANIVQDILDGLTASRVALNLGAVTIFCFSDYGLPSGEGYRHYGLLDKTRAKRTVYGTLKNYRRSFGTGTQAGNIVPVGGPGGFTNADLKKNYDFQSSLPADWTKADGLSPYGSFAAANTNYEADFVTFVNDSAATGGKALELQLTDANKSPNANTGSLLHTYHATAGYKFTGGYVEFRAKLAGSSKSWFIVWTDGWAHPNGSVGWPRHGEIDIAETLGNRLRPQFTIHKSPTEGSVSGSDNYWQGGGPAADMASAPYHTFGMHWEPPVTSSGFAGRIRTYYDGTLHKAYTPSLDGGWVPSHNHVLVIYLVALDGADPPASDTARVDYVRVWQ